MGSRKKYTTARSIVSQVPEHGGCLDDLTTERSFDSQAMLVNGMLGLSIDVTSMGVYTTTHWQTSGRLAQE